MEDFKLSYKVYFNCGQRCSDPLLTEKENKLKFGEEYSPTGFGHNYVLTITVNSRDPKAESNYLSGKFRAEIKELSDHIKYLLDHKFLNEDIEHFKKVPPTLENICKYCFTEGQQYLDLKNSQLILNKAELEEGYFWKATVTTNPRYF